MADESDRESILAHVKKEPGRRFQEAEIKAATGVNKAIVRRLLRDVPGIDQEVLEKGAVRWTGRSDSETSG